MWNRELEVSKELAVQAGIAIMDIYSSSDFEVEYKKDTSPLTLADKVSNGIIMKGLKQQFPQYAILSEEEQDNMDRIKNDYCFIVDPLDGTKEFIKRNGQFTVNIALAYQHRTVVGVIYVPVTGDLYFASENEGAYIMKKGAVQRQRLFVNKYNKKVDISELKVVVSNSHECQEMCDLMKKYNLTNVVKMGSSLKGCLVASGEADIYYRFNPTMEWDTAAMQCIVEEAGGVFRQMDDTDMTYNRENSLNEKGFYAICEEQFRLR